MSARRTPVVATTFEPNLIELLRKHETQPTVIPYAPGQNAWEVPSDANALFVYARDFIGAPAYAPAGWPHSLQWIQTASAGVDAFPQWIFDVPTVTCGRHIASRNIAEFVLAAILLDEKQLDRLRIRSRDEWAQPPIGTLAGKTVGLLGVGAIGTEIVRRLQGFDTRILGFRRSAPPRQAGAIVWKTSLTDVLSEADHLVLALPQTKLTRHIINGTSLAKAKPGLHLINIARGGLIDHAALLAALDSGLVRAATLDVTDPEPLPAGHPLYAHPRVRLTPHQSGYSDDYDDLKWARICNNLQRFADGLTLSDVVDPEQGY